MSPILLTAGFAIGLLIALACWSLWNSNRQRRVLGPFTYRQCKAITFTLGRQAERVRTLVGAKWLCLIGGTWILFRQAHGDPDFRLIIVAACLLVVGIFQLTRQAVPGSILVLGSSNVDQMSLQAAIRDAVHPFRAVSLLETGGLADDMIIAGDCFRIGNNADWHDAFHAFSRTLPLLVLDLRRLTEHVIHEVEHLVVKGHLHKTVIVAQAEGRALVEATERRLTPQATNVPVYVHNSDGAVSLLRYLLFERETVPTPHTPLATLVKDFERWEHTEPASAVSPPDAVEVYPRDLAPFSYTPPAGWEMRVTASSVGRYAVLFRPPEEGGLRNPFRRRSRLDLMVFRYTSQTADEETLRRGTDFNLTQRGASITRERIGRRAGVVSHECFFQRGFTLGYIVRFIARGNEYVVHWMSMNGQTMNRHLPVVERFVESIVA